MPATVLSAKPMQRGRGRLQHGRDQFLRGSRSSRQHRAGRRDADSDLHHVPRAPANSTPAVTTTSGISAGKESDFHVHLLLHRAQQQPASRAPAADRSAVRSRARAGRSSAPVELDRAAARAPAPRRDWPETRPRRSSASRRSRSCRARCHSSRSCTSRRKRVISSSAANGSSSSSRRGSVTSARASDTRMRMPPESCAG